MSDVVQHKQVFREFFGEKMSAVQKTFQQLVTESRQHKQDSQETRWATLQNLQHFPIVQQLIHKFATCKKKAGGEDNILPEVFAISPCKIMEWYYPIYFKALFEVWWPIQWRGGMVQELPKPGKDAGPARSKSIPHRRSGRGSASRAP